MNHPLHFSDSLRLPIDAAAARFVILGKSGAGKTNSDTVMIEEFVGAGVPVIVIDPLGNMWGLRSSADGESPGLPIAIFGGRHGDVPLRADRGVYVADMLAEGVSAVLDLSLMTRDEQHEFVADFLPRLLSRVRVNMHVALEEAETFAPERATSKPHGRVRAATTVFARTARNNGMGWTFSTQKPQLLAKDVIDSSTAFLAMKMTGELAQDAIGAEVRSRAGKTLATSIITELPRFGRGEAWLIPDSDWLGDLQGEIPTEPLRFRFRWRRTFDSARPPKVGEERRDPRVLADVDIARLRAEMSDEPTVDTADVEALRARIKVLEASAASEMSAGIAEEEVAARIASAIQAERAESKRELERLTTPLAKVRDIVMAALGDGLVAMTRESPAAIVADVERSIPAAVPAAVKQPPRVETKPVGPLGQRIIEAIGWWAAAGVAAPTRDQVGFVSQAKPRGGHFANTLGMLRSQVLIDYPGPGLISLTPAGRERLPVGLPGKPTRRTLHERAMSVITEGSQRRVFQVLANTNGPLKRETLADQAGFTAGGGHFANTLGAMRTAGLIDYPSKGMVELASTFKVLS